MLAVKADKIKSHSTGEFYEFSGRLAHAQPQGHFALSRPFENLIRDHVHPFLYVAIDVSFEAIIGLAYPR